MESRPRWKEIDAKINYRVYCDTDLQTESTFFLSLLIVFLAEIEDYLIKS